MLNPNAPRATVQDAHDLAMGLPHVTVVHGKGGNPVYQVGGKSFVFFRTPRPDAVDPATGERFADVIVFWVESESEKQALVQDRALPFFTTSHFDGHSSVLLRASLIGELTRQELAEVIEAAWLSRASPARVAKWLGVNGTVNGDVEPCDPLSVNRADLIITDSPVQEVLERPGEGSGILRGGQHDPVTWS